MNTDHIGDVMNSLANLGVPEAKSRPIYTLITNSPDSILKVNSFFSDYVYPEQRAIKEAVKAVTQSKDAYIISSILLHFWTHKLHLEKIVTLTGMGCCADKAKAILNQYVHFLKTGVKPEWNPDAPNCFWLPKFGTQDQWFNFVYGIYMFTAGHADEFYATRNVLITEAEAYLAKIKELGNEPN